MNWFWRWSAAVALLVGANLRAAGTAPLRVSVYVTAGDALAHLADDAGRARVLERLRPLRVTRLFLEGRRGDEYVPPATLAGLRAYFAGQGIECAGGIATVPGSRFGVRQNEALGWLNWEAEATRRDVAGFFRENAPVFDALIVDDFYCTADTSAVSVSRKGARSWGAYRRDLLVEAMEPLILGPARSAKPEVRLILKFPQWYDRFHVFGYDPPRMAAPFDRVWVGTEVRDPATRRMGHVQPTEGYINFRWLSDVVGPKVEGAWFDHIECSAQNFVDQAFQSVLAGARELTLFRLGDVMEGHVGDAALAARLPVLEAWAARIQGQGRNGVAYYKPAGSEADDNLYLMDYLAMVGVPILPQAQYPTEARVAVLGVQAAADSQVLVRLREHLGRGATVLVTPAFLRKTGLGAAELAGVSVDPTGAPAEATRLSRGRRTHVLEQPLEVDQGVRVSGARERFSAETAAGRVPWLTTRRVLGGRMLMLNTRTFSERDFRDTGEWLLAPKPRGLTRLSAPVVDLMRRELLGPLGVEFEAPAGVALYGVGGSWCVYSFRSEPVVVRFKGRQLVLEPHGWAWVDGRVGRD